MSRKEALAALIDAVEAGEFPLTWAEINRAGVAHNSHGGEKKGTAWDAFNGSLDAALALHEAVLHERVVVELTYSARYGATVELWDMAERISSGASDAPSRALLLADLKVLYAQQGGDT